ncbi:hypothetical protein [Nocardia sp. NPDC057030]|uniref:hypothetical protein n=1 Tax=unclassified Nocardia TaxID=2637762 RepID=UPI00363C3AC5
MAVHVIASSLMTSDRTAQCSPTPPAAVHGCARSVGDEGWSVSYLPGRTLTRAQAVAAQRVAEVVPSLLGLIGELVDEVGLTALEAVGMAVRQSTPPAGVA